MPHMPPAHKQSRRGQYNRDRAGDAVNQFVSSRRWRKFRRWFLRRHPLCEHCGAPASEVHHVTDRRERPDLAFDEKNLLALCKPCHSALTAKRSFACEGVGRSNLYKGSVR